MSGKDLYAVFARAMNEQGIGIDPWDGLPEEDAAAWEAVAAQVKLVEP